MFQNVDGSDSGLTDSDESDGSSPSSQENDKENHEDRCSPGLSEQFKDRCHLASKSQRKEATNPYPSIKNPERHLKESNSNQRQSITKQEGCNEVTCAEKPANGCGDPRQTLRNLVSFISTVVSVANYSEFECLEDAKKLEEVTINMTGSHQLFKFLRVFGHSMSCLNDNCHMVCRMFRRTRAHVASAKHACAILPVYSQLLRLHIDTCVAANCGLENCKSMLAMRFKAGNAVLPRNFNVMEQMIVTKIKQADAIINGSGEDNSSSATCDLSAMNEKNSSLEFVKVELKEENLNDMEEAHDMMRQVTDIESSVEVEVSAAAVEQSPLKSIEVSG